MDEQIARHEKKRIRRGQSIPSAVYLRYVSPLPKHGSARLWKKGRNVTHR